MTSGLLLRLCNRKKTFLFLIQDICYGYSKHMLKISSKIKENIYNFTLKIFVYLNLCNMNNLASNLVSQIWNLTSMDYEWFGMSQNI